MPTATEKRKYTRLSASEWDSIIALYTTGASTLAELSARFDVAVSSIMNQAKARAVSRRAAFPATAALAIATAASATLPASTIPTAWMRGTAYATQEEKISATNTDAYADAVAIQHLIRCAIAALPSAPTTAQEAAAIVRAADLAATALNKVNHIRRTILRLDKMIVDADTPLPELPIYELTDIEVEVMRAQQVRDDREAGLGDDLEDDCETEADAPANDEVVEETGEVF